MATRADLSIDQGTDYEIVLTLTDEGGNILDLSNSNSAAQIRKSYTSLTYTEFATSINVESGEITLVLTADQTGELEPGRYVYDVEVTDATNSISRIVEGVVTISPQVTRL
jgi:hypothetical protein